MSVLVVVSQAEGAEAMVRWGARFARARETTLKVLHLGRGAKPQAPAPVPLEDTEDKHPTRLAIRRALQEPEIQRLTARFHKRLTERLEREQLELERRRLEDTAQAPEAGAAASEAGPATTEDANLAALREEGFLTVLAASSSDPVATVLGELKTQKVGLLVVGKGDAGGEAGDTLGDTLLHDAPCDTMLLRAQGESGLRCQRLLVPSAGGPHAKVALTLGAAMAEADAAVMSALYVEPAAGADEAREAGERAIGRILRQAGLSPEQPGVAPQVAVASSPFDGIARVAGEGGYDLLLVGASQEGPVKRLLYGTVPDRLLAGRHAMAVAVLRAARPLSERALALADQLLNRWIPQLERADRVTLFERLQEGSRFSFDFAALITVSTGIATLGLMQSSGAVVIGAMLVAPLMTPMIGAGLALVQGNTVLVGDSVRAIARGMMLAVGIGVLMGLLGQVTGLLVPDRLTAEILARGAPTVLDLVVAYLSGLAAAYALARPNLSGALPGVAIAAALVPPLGTVGICLSAQAWTVARGAALLFSTNLVAIMLGAASVFWAVGVRPNRAQSSGQLWAGRAVVGLALAVLILAGWFAAHLPVWVSDAERSQLSMNEALEGAVARAVVLRPGRSLVRLGAAQDGYDLEVVVAAWAPGEDAGLTEDVERAASRYAGRRLRVRVLVLQAAAAVTVPSD